MLLIIVVYGWASLKALSYTIVITCDRNTQNDCQNETLGNILNGIEGERDVHINIKTPQLQLNKAINITGLDSLTIIGKLDVQTSVICTNSQNVHVSTGIVLRNISGQVELHNITLASCGFQVQNKFDGNTYFSSLAIIHCGNV